MNNESIKHLIDSMSIPPDEIIDVNAATCEREAEMPDEMRERLEEMNRALIAVLSDDTIAFGVKFGYVISSIVFELAATGNMTPAQIHQQMMAECMAAERAMAIQDAISDFLNDRGHGPAPHCQECEAEARWCPFHRCWECPNPSCSFVGEVPSDGE